MQECVPHTLLITMESHISIQQVNLSRITGGKLLSKMTYRPEEISLLHSCLPLPAWPPLQKEKQQGSASDLSHPCSKTSCHQPYPIVSPSYTKSVEERIAQRAVFLTLCPSCTGGGGQTNHWKTVALLHDFPLHSQPPTPVSLSSYHPQGTSGDQEPSFRPKQDHTSPQARGWSLMPSHIGDTVWEVKDALHPLLFFCFHQ